ncbi:hypothetical protein H0H93_004186 [Arthromyces matolae]|nr:hypothetical protein H0H93_004186 [Arthromyces matolae]
MVYHDSLTIAFILVHIMHQCLRIQEILTNIFGYAFLYDGVEDYDSLTKLARTCKLFSNAALDLLWSSQPSLQPLLKCFPKGIIQVDNDSRLSIPEDKDFERVHFYASRIRSLNHDVDYATHYVDIVTCSLLLNQCLDIGRPLLPNLHHLTLGFSDFCGQAIFPRLVMAPNLRSIFLLRHTYTVYSRQLSKLNEDWKNIVAVLGPCLPLLRKFEIERDFESYHGMPVRFSKTLCLSFQQIQNLTIPLLELDLETLTHLAKMPTLNKFEFAISSESLLSFNPSLGDFSCIQDLAIHTNQIDGCANFLSCQPFLCLHNLSVIDDGTSTLVWSFDSLVKHMKTPSLRSLKLLKPTHWWSDLVDEPPAPFTRSTLESLLRIISLVHLEITFDLSVKLTDEELAMIPDAWPHLQFLSLPDNSFSVRPGLTFEGLFPLIKKCQNLKTLIIRVNAKSIPRFYSSGSLKSSRSLTHLGFCTSQISQSTDLIEIIPLLFPRLETLDISSAYKHGGNDLSPTELKYSQEWIHVIKALKPIVPSYGVP